MSQVLRVLQDVGLLLASLAGPAVKSVRENSGLAALSVVLAFGLWIFITDTENATTTRVLPEDIAVQPVNVPPDVALAEDIQPIRVRVRVADDVFDSLTAADFEATVDLDGLSVGEYSLPVNVRALTTRGGLRIEGVLPTEVPVRLAQLISKSVDVVVEVEGEPPPGFTMESPETTDATTLVTGPQEKVELVSQAIAVVDVSGRTGPVDQAVRLVPRDQRGFLVQGVILDPGITDVRIEIEQRRFSRALAVDPQLSGEPAEGYNIVSVSVNPQAVTVLGSQAFIEGATTISTRAVDVSGATQDVVRSVSLDVPSGASISGGVTVGTVTVRVQPSEGVLTFGVPVTASNLGDDLSIRGALPSVQVTLHGPLPVLRQLSPNDIGASVDLDGRDSGSHRLSVRVDAPADTEVRSVSPQEVDLTLETR